MLDRLNYTLDSGCCALIPRASLKHGYDQLTHLLLQRIRLLDIAPQNVSHPCYCRVDLVVCGSSDQSHMKSKLGAYSYLQCPFIADVE